MFELSGVNYEEVEFELSGLYMGFYLDLLCFFLSFCMHFFSGTKHQREDNPNLYCWAEMTGLHTQTFNIFTLLRGYCSVPLEHIHYI